MKKPKKAFIYYEQGRFMPLIGFTEKLHIQLGVLQTNKESFALAIRLTKKFTNNQVLNFLKKNKKKIKQLSQLLQENPIKIGKKQKVPAHDAYILHTKWNWKPETIDAFFTWLREDTRDSEEVNLGSINKAIYRQKKLHKRTK